MANNVPTPPSTNRVGADDIVGANVGRGLGTAVGGSVGVWVGIGVGVGVGSNVGVDMVYSEFVTVE